MLSALAGRQQMGKDARPIGGTTDAAGVDDETSEAVLSATYLGVPAHAGRPRAVRLSRNREA